MYQQKFPLKTNSNIHAVLLTLVYKREIFVGQMQANMVSVATSTEHNVCICGYLGSYTVPV